MGSRFVTPETVTIPISNGDTITVRKRITAGERTSMVRRASDRYDSVSVLISAYLLDWTIKDPEGNPVEINGKTPEQVQKIVDDLDPDDFDEIGAAVNNHYENMKAEREKEKNGQAGEAKSSQTSKSPESLVGLSTTSVN